ncbi:DUF1868 domain-containing protein [Legionella rowbothamii]|uniref:DUF1868 domain-containing protein n=1 Tax=Legionella rowbothamii TaxID=96229 RepID=UPI00105414EA|nr:DUF1868 domain-containing protein [Legionella rowbothamii]
MGKMNEHGKFTPFPGLSVISSIHSEDEPFWKNIFNFLQQDPLIAEHYSLLPLSSYHMTTYNLFVQNHTSEDQWLEFIDKNLTFFQLMHEHLLMFLNFSPSIIQSTKIITKPVLQLVVDISPVQKEKIVSIASFFNLSKNIAFPFHITLGYQLKELNHADQEKIEKTLWANVHKLMLPDTVLSLKPPTLSYFNDMTAFIPWDGRINPFRTSSTSMLDSSPPLQEKPLVANSFSQNSNNTFFSGEKNNSTNQDEFTNKNSLK